MKRGLRARRSEYADRSGYTSRGGYTSKSSYTQGLMKKLTLLILICFAIRLLSGLGAGDAFDNLLRDMGKSSGIIKGILAFELGTVPDITEKDAQPNVQLADEIIGILNPQADNYPSESNVSPQGQASSNMPSDTQPPAVTALTAEYIPLPTPKPPDALTEQTAVEVLNKTSYSIDINAMLKEAPAISLSKDSPQILIIHTHSSEAYSGVEASRTLDKGLNIIRVGAVLAAEFQASGFNVIHDTDIYDYPSYSGSYSRSLEAVEGYLKEYPEIQIVIDLHRDSMTLADGTKYRSEYKVGELTTSQVMLLVATGEAGLNHPNWRENLKFGLRLQKSMEDCYPGLARPLCISSERYNQHTVPGSILIEIGTDGNSLEEAVGAVRLFAASAEPVIKELIKP